MNKNLVFVSGVHGVGKSTFCTNFKNYYSDLEIISASSLIKNYKLNSFNKFKQVKNIEDNQGVLIKALSKYKTTKSLTFLDGHFCLLDQQSIPQKITAKTFMRLNISLIVLLVIPIEILIERLRIRDDFSHSHNILSELQDLEFESANQIAEELEIPLIVLTDKEIMEDFKVTVSKVLEAIKL